MARTCGAFVLLGSLVLGACGVGDEAAESDDRNEQLGIVCNATFKTTGTWAPTAPTRPADNTGCWPVGTWTFTATIDENECANAPALLPQYQFKVERAVNPDPLKDDGLEETVTWLGANTVKVRKVDVSEIASGCQAGVELFSMDGKQFWNMRPHLAPNGTMDGFGEYALYDSDQNFDRP